MKSEPIIISQEPSINNQETEGLLRKKVEKEKPRKIFVNEPLKNKNFKHATNSIHTARYTIVFFILENLFEQFHRVANIYFLLIALLQLIPGLSPTGRFSTIIPLSLVLTVQMIKDAFEDYKRRISDGETNNKKTIVLSEAKWKEVKWKDIQTGNIIKVENNEFFPADLILLSSSEDQGLCYVETSSLDGETNLKIKRASPETWGIKDVMTSEDFDGIIECENPNNRLYNFEGKLTLKSQSIIKEIPIDAEQILLRGSSLRNTEWIIGVVVYTGHESKLMMNQSKTPHKASKVEKLTNWCIFMMFLLEIVLAITCSIGLTVWNILTQKNTWYLMSGTYSEFGEKFDHAWGAIKGFFTFIILFNNLIPISLYVSMETAKFIQAYFISKDLDIYYEKTDTPAVCRTSSLNEELGQIEYLFSDKTGTLTKNLMEFLKFSVDGIAYGTGITEIAKASAKRKGIHLTDDRPSDFDKSSKFQFYDKRISNKQWTKEENSENLLEFFKLLALCHTVIPEISGSQVNYQAASPDEDALVNAARYLGVEFYARSLNSMSIKVNGVDEKWELLNVCEFSSNRKRSSVILKSPQGKIILFCKGADSIILKLLNPESKHLKETIENLETFAEEGLRTLLCAKCELDEETYYKWNRKYQEAKCSLQGRTEKIEEVANEIEKNLELVGATAIEDKLQDEVPETIASLMLAGIKVWMLTGDKMETAINIGFACDLLNNNMVILTLKGTKEEVSKKILEYVERIEVEGSDIKQVLALVVPGDVLEIIFKNDDMKKVFLRLAILCKAVICCRVSPIQKASIVSLVRSNIEAVTCSIGDGANDVSMIQTAHVGIGINGEEGLQACNSSDYAIGQFKFLKKLLLVHGRWNYRRVSKLILYSFYKNSVFYLTQFFYVFFNSFSGTSIHDRIPIMLYNVLFASLPIMVIGIWDQDVKAEVAMQYPELYHQGHHQRYFNFRLFFQYTANSIFHSACCFFIPYYGLRYFDSGIVDNGATMYTAVLFVISVRATIETASLSVLFILSILFSYILWFSFILIYSSLGIFLPFDLFYPFLGAYDLLISPLFWFVVLSTVGVATIRDWTQKSWKRNLKSYLYYMVIKDGEKKEREELMKGFPFEEDFKTKEPLFKKSFSLDDVKQLFYRITGKEKKSYKGFGFSQTEGQVDLLEQQFKRKSENFNKIQ